MGLCDVNNVCVERVLLLGVTKLGGSGDLHAGQPQKLKMFSGTSNSRYLELLNADYWESWTKYSSRKPIQQFSTNGQPYRIRCWMNRWLLPNASSNCCSYSCTICVWKTDPVSSKTDDILISIVAPLSVIYGSVQGHIVLICRWRPMLWL